MEFYCKPTCYYDPVLVRIAMSVANLRTISCDIEHRVGYKIRIRFIWKTVECSLFKWEITTSDSAEMCLTLPGFGGDLRWVVFMSHGSLVFFFVFFATRISQRCHALFRRRPSVFDYELLCWTVSERWEIAFFGLFLRLSHKVILWKRAYLMLQNNPMKSSDFHESTAAGRLSQAQTCKFG